MIDKIQENIENSYLFGCMKYKNDLSFYLMPIAFWILNYSKYDPTYNPKDWDDIYRDNLLNVSDENIELYLRSIELDKIDLDSVDVKKYDLANIFLFFIDFDSKIFISYFDDIDIEEYLPDESWVGKFDNPLNYLPEALICKL
ncbi:hypothetical protein H9N25_11855 [Pedobacter riviphilus]|uniref:Uncharacterized protein n=1 Tax=Pedobacter riviphilus TaxID=2766984 RepID=A0ABX6TN64_9SPHI|nr:hypothetical protein [Pedobacter riviphilus]QNR87019.1 hypothetical protein H9N25_11855 [Pedobacter riviphilus]